MKSPIRRQGLYGALAIFGPSVYIERARINMSISIYHSFLIFHKFLLISGHGLTRQGQKICAARVPWLRKGNARNGYAGLGLGVYSPGAEVDTRHAPRS